MLTALAGTSLAAAVAHPWHPGGGFWWWFLLIPLFWIGVVALIVALVGRRWRRGGPGPYGPGWHGPHGWGPAGAARGPEATLAERYANGDIDEKEYRARLEVLRSSAPPPPS